ncbi:putative protein phosphatase 2C 41 [Gossypium australe]|uniref:PPM-type phosphatase domain-containing protein n=1 Tax=Gossypium australe TaxID=47621 RepID=A0A5B6WJ28_9ROSI|nr:putative protein phosphatase 2C 41 [Gossypium australe]
MKKGKNTSSTEDDIGREVAETLAKDAKKNDLMLSSSATLKSNKSNNFASICSKRGQKGINQDCTIVWEEFGCQEDMIFCGIFDGHGPWGHIIAKRVKQSVPPSLLCNWQKALALTSLGQELNTEPNRSTRNHQFDIWKQSCLKTYAEIDQELKHHPGIDSFHSGTTALTIIKQEAERIRQSQGRVSCLRDEPGVYRVWMPKGDAPGLAVSRAIGDHRVKEFGLISVPDVTQRNVTNKDQFVILATDGVWDVISNEEAVEIVCSTDDREKPAKRLVQCAMRAWRSKKRGIAMDDISAICLFFHPKLFQEVNPFKASK